ncbi:LCP family protein, partial [Streptomyces sp. UNOC14_S4]|uniref:LCP family protein n=1 Tax=Streptomyces sp. UNOC14_S4 TaxID=2872340 RepID=UPI001E5EA264
WGRRVALGTALAVLGAGGVGHAVMRGIDARIDRIDAFGGLSHRPPRVGQGTNLLLVGTDRRDTITEDERRRWRLGGAPCHCTDTVMLVHLSAARDRATVVSLPRDTYTVLPARRDAAGRPHPAHVQKLNAAYAEGGPSLSVRSVERLTGVHVDHYLEVDFAGFMRTVDLLGGVRVCTDRPLHDSSSGLDLPVGASTLNGGQALQYVRARHLDQVSDLGRMQRQQRFLAALLHGAGGSGVLLNPVKFQKVATTLLDSMRADPGFGSGELIALGRAVKNLTPATTEFVSVPVSSVNYVVPNVGSTVRWNEAAAARIFQALREDRPLTTARGTASAYAARSQAPTPVEVAPAQVRVQVFNGTDRYGLARTTDQALRAAGFSTTGLPADAHYPAPQPRTVIHYDPRWDRSVRTLAAALPLAYLHPVQGQGPLMKVTVGTDFTTVHRVRVQDPVLAASDAVTGDRVVCR